VKKYSKNSRKWQAHNNQIAANKIRLVFLKSFKIRLVFLKSVCERYLNPSYNIHIPTKLIISISANEIL
jgi:hypothetical protein